MMDKAVLQAGTHHVLVMGDFNYTEINYEGEFVADGNTDPSTSSISHKNFAFLTYI